MMSKLQTYIGRMVASALRSTVWRSVAAVVVLSVAAITGGCTSHSDDSDMPLPPDPSAESGTLQAGFTITVTAPDSQGASSRAPSEPAGGYDPGAGYENYINIPAGDFRFYFFDADNLYLGAFKINALLPTGGTATSKTYYVTGEIPAAIKDTPLKILALANWRGQYSFDPVEGVTHIDDLCKVTYSFTPASMFLSESNTIPLYGVTDLHTLSFNVDNFATLPETIHLLRAFAKVEVTAGSDDTGFEVEKVTLTRHNNLGYCAPAGVYRKEDYVHGNYTADYVNTPHIPAGGEEGELEFMKSADGLRYTVYIPEYLNIGLADGKVRPETERARIHIEYSDDNEFYLEFGYYKAENGAPAIDTTKGIGGYFDICRNYWYRYTVRRTVNNIVLNVDVLPYHAVDLDPSFGIDPDKPQPPVKKAARAAHAE